MARNMVSSIEGDDVKIKVKIFYYTKRNVHGLVIGMTSN